jgi:(p)ppGpp synthase/HD superfamily hydrolase
VINLPEGATPVDFAYQIHSDIGNQCAGARVGGKIVSLDNPLSNGDMVEILIQKNKKPSEGWLSFVQTGYAYDRIKTALKRKRQIEVGRGLAKEEVAEFEFKVRDRIGLIKDISSIFSRHQFNIIRLSTDLKNKNSPYITAICEVKNKNLIEKVVPKLKKVKGIEQLTWRIHTA